MSAATNDKFDEDDWEFEEEQSESAAKMLGQGLSALDFSADTSLKQVGTPAVGLLVEMRLFSALDDKDEPIIPVPPDTMTDVEYQRRYVSQCVLCNAPQHLRLRAEHVFLEDPARKPQSVVNFFAKYYNARITHQCVDAHMNRHCYLNHLYRDGIQALAQEEGSAMVWKYRELDLIHTSLVRQLGRIEGLDTRTRDDMHKQNASLMSIHDRIMKVRKERDDAAVYGINPFESLGRLLEKMPTKETKKLVAEEARNLRELLSRGQDSRD